MKAMILAAGVGSRLDPLTRNVPKPLVPIVNRPVMEYLILLLKKHGFDEIMINTHYLGSKIEAYFGDGAKWGGQIYWESEDNSTPRPEKTQRGASFSPTPPTPGVSLSAPGVFLFFPADTFFLFGKQVFPLLLELDQPLYGHLTKAYWKDVGNLRVYQQTHRDVLNGLVKASQPFKELSPGIWVGENVQIAPTAELTAPLAIGDNVSIKAGAQVSDHT